MESLVAKNVVRTWFLDSSSGQRVLHWGDMSQSVNAPRTDAAATAQRDASEHDVAVPWSHRQNWLIRLLITLLAAIGSTCIGTVAQRMGASVNIPYGLVLALVLVGLSAWCARSRMGGVGLAIHLIVSSITAYMLAASGPLGDALVPLFSAESPLPYFSRYMTWYWLGGMIAVQTIMLFLPSRWFRIGARD